MIIKMIKVDQRRVAICAVKSVPLLAGLELSKISIRTANLSVFLKSIFQVRIETCLFLVAWLDSEIVDQLYYKKS